jgi:regulator of sigma E protease
MMSFVGGLWSQLESLVVYALPFLVVLTVVVFVHELGHYLIARFNGVRVEVFSIGFGRELYGWTAKSGTHWRIALIPLGGYVKFFGDANAASAGADEAVDRMTPEERQVAFHHKRVGQRAAIVAAGPFANFVYAVFVLALLFMFYGQRVTPPEVGRVLPDTPAAAAGFQPGDVIQAVDGDEVRRFEEVEEAVLLSPDRELTFRVQRGDRVFEVAAAIRGVDAPEGEGLPRRIGELGLLPANAARVGQVTPGAPAEAAGFQPGDLIVAVDGREIDNFEQLQDIVANSGGRTLRVEVLRAGERVTLNVAASRQEVASGPDGETTVRWLIGVQRAPRPLLRLDPAAAAWEATKTSVNLIERTLEYLGEMIVGSRGTEELGGPLRIAHASGQAAQVGLEQLVLLSALLSLNLGFFNLLPIPILDGGHLLMYGIEGLRGRPLTERMQEYAFRVGLAVILSLTVFATWNDLVHFRVVEFISGLFS